jgi:clathrin heavy chain
MNEDVTFWTWINDSTLGMVTEHSVHHWKVTEGQAAPQKVS